MVIRTPERTSPAALALAALLFLPNCKGSSSSEPPPEAEDKPKLIEVSEKLDATYKNLEELSQHLTSISRTLDTMNGELEVCYGNGCETTLKQARTQTENLRRNRNLLERTVEDYLRLCDETGGNDKEHPKSVGVFRKEIADADRTLKRHLELCDGR